MKENLFTFFSLGGGGVGSELDILLRLISTLYKTFCLLVITEVYEYVQY
jgi:hypothetical protein